MTTRFAGFIFGFPGRLAMPIGVNAGLTITGATVRQVSTQPRAQAEAVLAALHEHLNTPIMLTAMDLSAVFHAGTPQDIQRETCALLQKVGQRKNFVISCRLRYTPRHPSPESGNAIRDCQKQVKQSNSSSSDLCF